ncbi:hypothetical protein ACWDRR_22090 [Kitasatospora sp. NPDC003701]
MAAALPPRRGPRAAAGGFAVATLGLLVALAGCAAPGELRDAGAARPVTAPPVRQPLWPSAAAAPSPTSPATASSGPAEPPPTPVPDVAVPGPDLTSVDVRALLAKDPAVSADERRALSGCADCEVRAAEFRDLTGDGHAELITAIATGGPVVLHVYTQSGGGVVPVLRVEVLKGFSAETVATDLWLHEPSTALSLRSSHYRWDGTRLSLLEQRLEAIGPIGGPTQGTSASPEPTATAKPTAGPLPVKPAVSPSAGAGAVPRTGQPVPAPRPPEATPTAVTPTALPTTPAIPEPRP